MSPPSSYTLVQQNSLFGPATTTSVYRDRAKAAIDLVQPGTHVRTVGLAIIETPRPDIAG
jgi:hypothetical protein